MQLDDHSIKTPTVILVRSQDQITRGETKKNTFTHPQAILPWKEQMSFPVSIFSRPRFRRRFGGGRDYCGDLSAHHRTVGAGDLSRTTSLNESKRLALVSTNAKVNRC